MDRVMAANLDDETLKKLYAWIDEIPLSRPKKNIARDFSDGILTAEVVAYYFPKLIQMHNYSPANSVKQKQYNWNTLNRKVFRRLHLVLSKEDIDDLVQCRVGAIERVLIKLQMKIAHFREKRPCYGDANSPVQPEFGHTNPARNSYARVDHDHDHDDDNDMLNSPSRPSLDGSLVEDQVDTQDVNQVSEPIDPRRWKENHAFQRNSPVASKSTELRQAQQYKDPLADHVKAEETSGPVVTSRNGDKPSAATTSKLLAEKDQTIAELGETIQILEQKVQKLEQLVRLKDGKILTLVAKLKSQNA